MHIMTSLNKQIHGSISLLTNPRRFRDNTVQNDALNRGTLVKECVDFIYLRGGGQCLLKPIHNNVF